MNLMTFAAYAVRRMRQWPPEYPERATLLTGSTAQSRSRDEWTAREWRDYALFLEQRGARLRADLDKSESLLSSALDRLRRSERKSGGPRSLLWWQDKPRRGRPKGARNESFRIALECVLISDSESLSDIEALKTWCARNGHREQRANSPASMGGFSYIIPRMRNIREEQKK